MSADRGSVRVGAVNGEDPAVRGPHVRLSAVVQGPVEDAVVTAPVQHGVRGGLHLRDDPHLAQVTTTLTTMKAKVVLMIAMPNMTMVMSTPNVVIVITSL